MFSLTLITAFGNHLKPVNLSLYNIKVFGGQSKNYRRNLRYSSSHIEYYRPSDWYCGMKEKEKREDSGLHIIQNC